MPTYTLAMLYSLAAEMRNYAGESGHPIRHSAGPTVASRRRPFAHVSRCGRLLPRGIG